MSIETSVETIRKVWIGEGYFFVRTRTRDLGELYCMVEACTEPGKFSEDRFGRFSITFDTPGKLRTLAKVLELAAADMENSK